MGSLQGRGVHSGRAAQGRQGAPPSGHAAAFEVCQEGGRLCARARHRLRSAKAVRSRPCSRPASGSPLPPLHRAPLWLVPLLVLFFATGVTALEVPYLSGRVVDLADLIPAGDEQRIEDRLAAIEKARGSQIAVLTLPSLEGEVLEDFSLRVAEAWKLGREKFDDGALLVIARDERRMRLEVGYGLEPTVTDAHSKRILDDVIGPRFRAGDFPGGVEAAVGAIEGLLAGSADALPPPAAEGAAEMPAPARAGVFLVFLLVVGMFSVVALGAPGCAGWFLYAFLMPFWLAFPLALLGRPTGLYFLPVWIVGFPNLRALFRKRLGGTSGWGGPFLPGGRGWSSTRGWRGGGGGWSGGGGGGFSGGGSFGGGGASSGW